MKYYVVARPNAHTRHPALIGPFEDGPAAVRDSVSAHGEHWQRWRMVLSEDDLREIGSKINLALSAASA